MLQVNKSHVCFLCYEADAELQEEEACGQEAAPAEGKVRKGWAKDKEVRRSLAKGCGSCPPHASLLSICAVVVIIAVTIAAHVIRARTFSNCKSPLS